MESKPKNIEGLKVPQSTRNCKVASDDQDQPDSPEAESHAQLITPTNISIGHLYVYNFASPTGKDSTSCSLEIPISAKKNKVQSPGASSGPICRICHEGDGIENLVSPCHCAGTVGLIHLSCMERWLSLAGSDKCEICNYTFVTIRSPKSFVEWIRNSASDSQLRRSLMSDLMCFLLLTPLAGVSSFLCVEGARRQILEENSLEAGCLMALATFLVTIYFIWNLLTCRFHLNNYFKWRSSNQNVKVLRVRRLSSPIIPQIPGFSQNLEERSETSIDIQETTPNDEMLCS